MKKSKLRISYSELKKIYLEVISFTKANADWYKNPNKNTRIEQDLGLYGLDNEDFLTEFSKKFNVDFADMEYEKFLTPESEVANGKYILLLPIILPYWLIKTILYYILSPFSKNLSQKVKFFSLIAPRKDVTIGDLIVSVIEGKFAERSKTEIELKTV